jgi:hypothetical protein
MTQFYVFVNDVAINFDPFCKLRTTMCGLCMLDRRENSDIEGLQHMSSL